MTDQLRQDLHDLMAEVDRGWCAYTKHAYSTHVSYGIGGCLMEQMWRVTTNTHICGSRENQMIAALGFNTSVEMFVWNDNQRDPDVIKRRIKDAIENL